MWIFYSLASRFLWSGTNLLEQFLSRAYDSQKTLSVLTMLFCCMLPFSVISYFMSENIYWSYEIFLYSFLALLIFVVALIPYLKSLRDEEAYNVVPFLELTPVFLTIFSVIIYHEHLTLLQWLGGSIVIFSAFIFSWNFEEGRLKKKIVILMSISAFCFASYQFLLKGASEFGDVWMVTFYFTLCEFILGVVMILVLKKVRLSIFTAYKKTSGKVLILSITSNFLDFLALVSLILAFQQAPTTGHVAALSGIQPFFLFFMAWIIGKRIPKHYKPIIFDKETKVKLFLLLGIFLGVYLLLIDS